MTRSSARLAKNLRRRNPDDTQDLLDKLSAAEKINIDTVTGKDEEVDISIKPLYVT